MIQLRLFRSNDPFQQLEERCLDDGAIVIGRDPSADWVIADERCELSRRHCTIAASADGAVLRDTSSNGVFLGDNRRRVERDRDLTLPAYETIHLGDYMIVVEPREPSPANDTVQLNVPFGNLELSSALSVRSDWEESDAPISNDDAPRSLTDAALLDAFCAGAGLDASNFIGEDPERVLYRAGAMYKQMVLGLGDLLSERHSVKSDLNMDRTTVGASGNNPFKWAPTRRVAIDLLRERNDGFLSGQAALKVSFEDLKKHALCLMAGSRSAVNLVFDRLAPTQIEEEARGTYKLRLNKADACWRHYQHHHEALTAETNESSKNAINAAFRKGYEQCLRELDETGTRA